MERMPLHTHTQVVGNPDAQRRARVEEKKGGEKKGRQPGAGPAPVNNAVNDFPPHPYRAGKVQGHANQQPPLGSYPVGLCCQGPPSPEVREPGPGPQEGAILPRAAYLSPNTLLGLPEDPRAPLYQGPRLRRGSLSRQAGSSLLHSSALNQALDPASVWHGHCCFHLLPPPTLFRPYTGC